MTGVVKGKQPGEEGWVRKALEKEVGFDLEHAKETFMEAKKCFAEVSTLGSQNKVQETSTPIEVDPFVLTTFLETCMKLLRDSKAVKGLQVLINRCVGKETATDEPCVVRKLGKHKARIERETRLMQRQENMKWIKLSQTQGPMRNFCLKRRGSEWGDLHYSGLRFSEGW